MLDVVGIVLRSRPKKLALTARMRTPLTILDAMARTRAPWQAHEAFLTA